MSTIGAVISRFLERGTLPKRVYDRDQERVLTWDNHEKWYVHTGSSSGLAAFFVRFHFGNRFVNVPAGAIRAVQMTFEVCDAT